MSRKYSWLFVFMITLTAGMAQNSNDPSRIPSVQRYLGPNALPVAEMQNALPDTLIWGRISNKYHHSSGDQTYNLRTTLHLPLYNDRVSLRLMMVPVEFFEVTEQTVLERNQSNPAQTGSSVGDLYVSTHLLIVRETSQLPSVQGIITLRTASGGNTGQSRFIDSPGYSFVVAIGKTYSWNFLQTQSTRIYINGGLRVYQTHRDRYLQNDLFVHGTGIDLNWKHFTWYSQFTGYVGYFDKGDKPLVVRSGLRTSFEQNLNFGLELQRGNRDFDYSTVSLSALYRFR